MKTFLGGKNGSLENASRKQKLAWGGVLIIIGAAVSGLGYTNYQSQSNALDNAVNVTATVTGTEVNIDRAGKSPDYSPVISFNYTHQDETYTSNNMYPPGDTQKELDSRSAAAKVTNSYTLNNKVSAYINPENPGEAFLKKKRSKSPLIFIGIGALIVLAGLYVSFKP